MSHGLSVVGRKEKSPKQCCLVNFFGRDGQPQRGQKVGDILRPYYFLLLVVEEAEGVAHVLLRVGLDRVLDADAHQPRELGEADRAAATCRRRCRGRAHRSPSR